jgi:adenosylmethionine-8-amino-7-oxononanoate aminotransferase
MSVVKDAEVVIARGEGAYIWDEQGNRYLDGLASLWYANVGHGRKEIADAVAAQMAQLETFHTMFQFANRPALDLCERVSALSPLDDAKVFLTSGGSDAIDAAGKLARRYWHAMGKPEKRTIISRERAYHGLHILGTSVTGLHVNREGLGPLLADTAQVGTNEAGDVQTVVDERGADAVAAYIAEPIVGSGGVIHPAPGYFEAVQQICRDNDILFIADEVITGFGRTGEWFGSQRLGLAPDMMTTAKGLSSGYLPIGGVIVSKRLWEPFWEDGTDLIFRHGLTYAGHATACAAALANLDIIERENLIGRVRELESVLAGALRPLESHELVVEVRTGIGLLTGVALRDHPTAVSVMERCLAKGVMIRPLPDGVLGISPPFVVTEDDIAFLAEVIAAALDDEARAA